MYEVIVVPLDGSADAEQILPDVEEIARKFDGELLLVQVVWTFAQFVRETATASAPELSIDIARDRERGELERATQYLEQQRARLESNGLRASVIVAQGEASTGILTTAAERGASLVAMTTHGRSGITRMFYGSVAEDVLRHSTVPVLLKPSRR